MNTLDDESNSKGSVSEIEVTENQLSDNQESAEYKNSITRLEAASDSKSQKSKLKWVLLVTIPAALILASVATYFITNKETAGVDTNKVNISTPNSAIGTKLIHTDYTTHKSTSASPLQVTVVHPSNWVVEQAEESTGENNLKVNGTMKIFSEKGNYIEFRDVSPGGYGGSCSGEVRFKIIKKIFTNTKRGLFIQMENVNPEGSVPQSSPETLDFLPIYGDEAGTGEYDNPESKRFTGLNEGDTFTGDCSVLATYPFVRNRKGDSTIFITLRNKNKKENQKVTYDEVKNDKDFIAMLRSLDVKE